MSIVAKGLKISDKVAHRWSPFGTRPSLVLQTKINMMSPRWPSISQQHRIPIRSSGPTAPNAGRQCCCLALRLRALAANCSLSSAPSVKTLKPGPAKAS